MRSSFDTNKNNAAILKKTQIPVKVKPQIESKNVQKEKKKTESPSTGSAFKSLQSALNSLDINDLNNLLDATWVQFKNDMIMLRTVLKFLNEKIRLEKPEDSLLFDKPLDYPSNILPEALRTILKNLIGKCGIEYMKHYFQNVLQSLCDELNHSRNFIGHLIILQQIAQYYPEVCVSNMASTVILRNSYQNQPSICLSLFWALGSSGIRDTTIGLKVWTEIICSVINVKSYTRFAFEYLYKILAVSNQTPDLEICVEKYKSIVSMLLTNDPKLKDLPGIKTKCIKMLTAKFIKGIDPTRVESLFLLLLRYVKSDPEIFARELVKCLEMYPEDCLNIWKMDFENLSRQSLIIFNYIGKLLS